MSEPKPPLRPIPNFDTDRDDLSERPQFSADRATLVMPAVEDFAGPTIATSAISVKPNGPPSSAEDRPEFGGATIIEQPEFGAPTIATMAPTAEQLQVPGKDTFQKISDLLRPDDGGRTVSAPKVDADSPPFGSPAISFGEPAAATDKLIMDAPLAGRPGIQMRKVAKNSEPITAETLLPEAASFADPTAVGLVSVASGEKTPAEPGPVKGSTKLYADPDSGEGRFAAKVKTKHLREARSILEILETSPDLLGLSRGAVDMLYEELVPVRAPSGQALFLAGDSCGPMYIVKSGRLRVRRESGGAESVVGYPEQGRLVGVVSCLQRSDRQTSVDALSNAELLALSPESCAFLYEKSPDFRRAIDLHLAAINYDQEVELPLEFAEHPQVQPAEVREAPMVRRSQVPGVHPVIRGTEAEPPPEVSAPKRPSGRLDAPLNPSLLKKLETDPPSAAIAGRTSAPSARASKPGPPPLARELHQYQPSNWPLPPGKHPVRVNKDRWVWILALVISMVAALLAGVALIWPML